MTPSNQIEPHMNVLIVTIPLRPVANKNRPIGPLSIMKYMRLQGFDGVELYDIDMFRPSFEEALAYVIDKKPDVLGLSAVVSTAYEYTKKLSIAVRKALPDCLIVMGGNMGASAEIVLKKTEVDIVVLDDGEIPFYEICEFAKTTKKVPEFKNIKGLIFLDQNGELVNTGYGATVPLDQMWDFDLEDLRKSVGTLDEHVPFAYAEGTKDIWFRDLDRKMPKDSRVGVLDVAKGCVARCTFCHRWTKGLRHVPVPVLKQRLDDLVDNYNVRFVSMNAESFGNDKRWLAEFLDMIKPYNLVWRAHGVRANTFTKEWIERMADAGCSGMGFGNETGSQSMLEVMEKKVDIQDNYNSMKWTIDAGIQTGVQLVVGMPGESPETIKETIEYCKYVTSLIPDQDPNNMSINYAQALPGTALYEYGRAHGMIGRDIDSEEQYLLDISDSNAHDETTTLNFTEYPTLTARTWRPQITIETNYHYVKKFGLDHYRKGLTSSDTIKEEVTGYFANPKRLLEQGVGQEHEKSASAAIKPPSLFKYVLQGRFGAAMLWHPITYYRMRKFLPLLILIKTWKNEGIGRTWELLVEYLSYKSKNLFLKRKFSYGFKSLRKIVNDDIGPLDGDSAEMEPIRKGR